MLKKLLLLVVPVCVLLASALGARAQGQQEKGGDEVQSEGRVRAPELEGGRGWLNTDAPLSLAALRGKVVLLDFWTYGCVNCIHVIPDLKRLEEKYARQLVVIGVHSAKFENEKETENIRRIVVRYGVEHPVVNDADFKIWNAYTVQAWPTLVLIDTAGYVVGEAAGEGHYAALDRAIGQLVEEARKRGTLNEQPLKLALERAKVGDLPLAFPGKLLADERGDRLFIADSNHNRVVVTKLDGTLLYVVGSGEAGAKDGTFEQASFQRPQGLALDGETLYVADTGNHLIRRVDLKARNVETVAGTGEQLRDYRLKLDSIKRPPLSSPWDLHLVGRTLYIAMAGPHQIWKMDLQDMKLSVFAGSGREARYDGARDEAAFAQPSGLASDGKTLYVADSESNIIRAIGVTASPALKQVSLPTSVDEEVTTLAGGDLFDFGDRDGKGDDVRLQHPLGVFFHEGLVFVADTYNHKIKLLDPRARTVKIFVGTGRPGQADGALASFYEPGGLSVARGRLYVADTNNHAVRVVDLKTKQSATLVIRGLVPPAQASNATDGDAETAGPNAEEIKLAPQRLALTSDAEPDAALVIDVALPAGHHLNPSAPQRYRVEVADGKTRLALLGDGKSSTSWLEKGGTDSLAVTSKDLRLPLRLPLRALSPGASELRVRMTLFYCREDNTGTCRIKTLVWRAPIVVTDAAGAPREIKLQGKLE
ncbi:MAG TPA: thioredoxin-like domain-containing protein [Pyrinomonadaceae bacterium]|nr:thioredoxin-like domain-containing protein [Pyrinomonadaceae bacterium]